MSPLDLIKATIVCAAIAFLVYTYPVLSQVMIIGFLALVWSSYLYRTIKKRGSA